MNRQLLLVGVGTLAGLALSVAIAVAWQGPQGIPPTNNVSAPINVGATDQTKNGNLGVNGLAVFGNTLLRNPVVQALTYLNFGATSGDSGYGFRDNAGKMQYKNSGGVWTAIGSGGGGGGGGGIFAWVKVPSGMYQGANFIAFSHGGIGPMQHCVNSGYTVFVGACRGSHPQGSTYNMEGSVLANTSGRSGVGVGNWAWSCMYGGDSYNMDKNSEILCAK